MSNALKNNQPISIRTDATKAKQINIRLNAEQERLLMQHCVRERLTQRDVVVAALARTIDGFDAA